MKWFVLTLAFALSVTGSAIGADKRVKRTCAAYAAECKSSPLNEKICKASMLDTIIGFIYAYKIYAVSEDGGDPKKLRGCSAEERLKNVKIIDNNILYYYYVSSIENKNQPQEFCIIDAFLDLTSCEP